MTTASQNSQTRPSVMRQTILLPAKVVSFALLTALTPVASGADSIDFNRDIRPILSDKCYACHGPDEADRQGGNTEAGGLRFDTRQGAFTALDDERFAIVPRKPTESELVQRIWSSDEDEVMPPVEHRKQLTEDEKQRLTRWIEQGAIWSQHWSYAAPRRDDPPDVEDAARVTNWIDQYILARLEREQITPSPTASANTLVRRLFFDLVGLPPQPHEVESFDTDPSELAWEQLIDRLLDSPHFGERMAVYWLDLVRYADTVGYHGDQDVSVSPFREYVIAAFNANMPFDQFTREQLAGDLMAEPSQAQLVASGYNRLGMMSAEGGVQDKEYLAKYAADRVRTASAVWLGSTLGCAECHDHKFDPFTTKDFYRFAAFFADIKERGLYAGAHADGAWGPKITIEDDELPSLLEPIDAALHDLQERFDTQTPELAEAQRNWERDLIAGQPDSLKLPDAIRTIVDTPATQQSDEQRATLAAHYRSVAPSLASLREQIAKFKEERSLVLAEHTQTSLITVSVKPREMRVLPRGDWMDASGEVVQPGVPGFLRQIGHERRATRLDLADWLVSPDNPLTARVLANRLWKLLFGAGLAKVLDDVGGQGEQPVHPELLDALAVELMESGWDVKHLIKMMVMSSSYRQSSLMREDLAELDPYNRLLARQSRFRLDAEMVRDNALEVSGLLVKTIGGKSAKPYQPAGLYRHLNFPKREYKADTGLDQYRRGVYTHWQRQFLHPAMKSFDAPPREECTAERARSNTPLAALVLLNDPSYVEAARVLATNALRQTSLNQEERIDWIVRRALARHVQAPELSVLGDLAASQYRHYLDNLPAAIQLTSVGLSPVPSDLDLAELAAWTSVTRTVFNMHEFITRN